MPAVPERVLLVEGPDDEHVVSHLCARQPNMPEFKIKQKGGINELANAIEGEIKVSGRQSVGVLVDANADPSARWQSITDRLRAAGVNAPARMRAEGSVILGQPRVGIWLMPNNQNPGEIEDFVHTLIPNDDPVWPLATQYIDGIPPEYRRFTDAKVSRAKIHAWLAAREEPRLMGAAIGTGELSADRTLALNLINWLRALFDSP